MRGNAYVYAPSNTGRFLLRWKVKAPCLLIPEWNVPWRMPKCSVDLPYKIICDQIRVEVRWRIHGEGQSIPGERFGATEANESKLRWHSSRQDVTRDVEVFDMTVERTIQMRQVTNRSIKLHEA